MFECARALTRDCELNVLLPFNTTYFCGYYERHLIETTIDRTTLDRNDSRSK